MTSSPKPFEVHESGALLHGTKADLAVGDLLVPGRRMNLGGGRIANYVYVSATLDAAAWGAELAVGEGRNRIYIVEPLGAVEDDPNVTDKKFQATRRGPTAPASPSGSSANSCTGWATRPSSCRPCARALPTSSVGA